VRLAILPGKLCNQQLGHDATLVLLFLAGIPQQVMLAFRIDKEALGYSLGPMGALQCNATRRGKFGATRRIGITASWYYSCIPGLPINSTAH
jgi:hypothetical protein